MRLWGGRRKPDPILASIVAVIVLTRGIWETARIGEVGGASGIVQDPTKVLCLLYVAFEGIRCAWPLAGIIVGAGGATLLAVPSAVRDCLLHGFSWALLPQLLVFILCGAVFGAVPATVAWLLRRTRNMHTQPVAGSLPTHGAPSPPIAAIVAVAAAVIMESLLLALESDPYYRLPLRYYLTERPGCWSGWLVILQFYRPAVTALASVAAYLTLRRLSAARASIVAYVAAGLLLAALRAALYRNLGLHGIVINPQDYDYGYGDVHLPIVPFRSFAVADLVELAGRAMACAAGIIYARRSGRSKT